MKTRLIVSAIIINDKKEVFLQKRWKPKLSPSYLGVYEIPAGGVDEGESAIEAVKREVFEETGLEIEVIDPNVSVYKSTQKGDEVQVFEPFLGQQMLQTKEGLLWVGFAFVCKVIGGDLKMNLEEAKDPLWVNVEKLKEMLSLEPDNFFPLQVPVLKAYCKSVIF